MLGAEVSVVFSTGSQARCVGIEFTTLSVDHVFNNFLAQFAVSNAHVW